MMQRLTLIALLTLLCSPTFAAELQVIDPWVREPPPGATVVGAFMELKNPGNDAIVIEAVSSPISDSVEMHRTVHSDGMARMVPQTTLTVPAGGSLVLEPGSYHLMIMNPPRLKAGDRVALTLQLADGSGVAIDAEVRRTVGGGHQHHHH